MQRMLASKKTVAAARVVRAASLRFESSMRRQANLGCSARKRLIPERRNILFSRNGLAELAGQGLDMRAGL